MKVIKWLSIVKKYKHIAIGGLICCLYFLNILVVNAGVKHYIVNWLTTTPEAEIIQFLLSNQSADEQNVYYYTLVFMMMFWVYLILGLIIAIIQRKLIITKIKTIINDRSEIVIKLLKYICFLLVLTTIVYLANIILFPTMKTSIGDNQSIINIVLLENPNIYIFVVIILLSPLVEEYIFRYGLINNLLKNQNRVIQVLLSSVIFSFIHIGFAQAVISPTYFIHLLLLYMPMSLVYSYVYVKERNIVFPVALHILNNIGSIIIVLLFK